MPVKKYLLSVTVVALSIICNKATAQHYNNTYREDSWHVTVGPDFIGVINPYQNIDAAKLGDPTSVTYSRLGVGGTIHAEYYPSPFVGLTIGTGLDFIPKTGKNDKVKSLIIVPVTIGAKAFFSQTMYLGAEAGLGESNVAYKGSKLTKIVSPQIGYNDNDNGLDVNLRYEVLQARNQYLSFFALHIAYSFDLSPTL